MRRRAAAMLAAVAVVAGGCGGSGSDPAVAPIASSTTIADDGAKAVAEPNGPILRTGAMVLADDGFRAWSGQRVGLIANGASLVGGTHLADLLDADPDVDLVALFGPEHGVRTDVAAGELIDDSVDPTTGVPIFSLYGDTRQPTAEMLAGVDLLVYDLQDVGTRYFTFISTMGLAMQAAAEANIPFVVLDRPNPQGGAVAGFVRDPDVDSFVAQYPLADVYALTAGELATAIVGEEWLPGLASLDLQVIEMTGWDRSMLWPDTGLEWIAPSPALTTVDAALLYPALVYFEATTIAVGRDSDQPFERFGAPWIDAEVLAADLNAMAFAGVRFDAIAAGTVGIRVEDPEVLSAADLGVHLLTAVLRLPGAEDALERPEFLDLLAGGPLLRERLLAGDDPATIIADRAAAAEAFAATVLPYHRY